MAHKLRPSAFRAASRRPPIQGQRAQRRAEFAKAFAAAEIAINSVESTQRSEAFKEKFNFTKSGEKPRAMAPADKDGIQAEVMPVIAAAVTQTLADCNQKISHEQTDDFVRVVTSPELHQQAA